MCMVQIYTCFEKEVSYYINSVTACLYFLPHSTFLFQKHRIKLYPGFFFFFSPPARFFVTLTAYCGHSNQHRHLPALFGLLHTIKNTIIRMDHHLLNHPDWRISQSGSERHCTTHLSYWIFYFGWVSWYRWDCWVNRNERLMFPWRLPYLLLLNPNYSSLSTRVSSPLSSNTGIISHALLLRVMFPYLNS